MSEFHKIKDGDGQIHRLSRVVGGGLVALCVTLVLGALTVFGIINVNLGHVLLFLAWGVAAIFVCAELIAEKTWKHKILAVFGLLFFFLLVDVGMVKLKGLQDTPPASRKTLPDIRKEPDIPPAVPQPQKTSTTDDPAFAVARLSELGWTVQPGPDFIQFEIVNKPLPPMKESASYFGQLKKPFRLHFQSVKGIDGLHYLAGISGCAKIEINAGEFTDISELRGFGSLTSLSISQTPLSGFGVVDISPISTLSNLRELILYSTKTKSVEPVAALKKLKTLNLSETLVTDLSPITSLVSLESLDITGTRISDLDPVSEIESLKELALGGAQIPGLVSLARLKNLKSLRITEQGTVDLSPVGTLTNLESLTVWEPPQFNMLPLGNLTKLRELWLLGIGFGRLSTVTDVDALGKLKELRKLTLRALEISDLTFVSNLKNLSEIDIAELPISSVAPLRGLTSLSSVSLFQTPVVDISPLLDLPALSKFSVPERPQEPM